jgi:hypothetical protein
MPFGALMPWMNLDEASQTTAKDTFVQEIPENNVGSDYEVIVKHCSYLNLPL